MFVVNHTIPMITYIILSLNQIKLKPEYLMSKLFEEVFVESLFSFFVKKTKNLQIQLKQKKIFIYYPYELNHAKKKDNNQTNNIQEKKEVSVIISVLIKRDI